MKHFVMTDIHGMGELFDEAIDYMETCGEEYQLIYLGDACDRGPDGFRIMQHLLAMVEVGKCIYLRGNHEEMFAESAEELMQYAADEHMTLPEYRRHCGGMSNAMCWGYNSRLHYQNGGINTIKGWVSAGMPLDMLRKLRALPVRYTLDQFDFCHSGCCRKEWNDKYTNKEDMIWNREHFHEWWFDGRTQIHGHTSVRHVYEALSDEEKKELGDYKPIRPLRYRNKIDLDVTSFRTDCLGLYCLEDDNFVFFCPDLS